MPAFPNLIGIQGDHCNVARDNVVDLADAAEDDGGSQGDFLFVGGELVVWGHFTWRGREGQG